MQNKGELEVGKDADIVIWDPDAQHVYGENDLHDNVGYNPWAGHEVSGWPVQVFLRGMVIAEDGEFCGNHASGQWIDRPKLATKPSGVSALEVRAIYEVTK